MSSMKIYTRKELKGFSKNELIDIILSYQEIFVKLESRISALEKDSSTSSKPPSSDISPPQKNKSQRVSSGNPPGGQIGHQGSTRKRSIFVDKTVECLPSVCTDCGNDLSGSPYCVLSTRQEVDIPPIEPVITDYQRCMIRCSCGCENTGEYPSDIKAPVQLGKNIQALNIYFSVSQLIPYKRLQDVNGSIFGAFISKKSIDSFLERAYDNGKSIHKKIKDYLSGSDGWVGSDETSKKVCSKRWWEWVWQNDNASYYIMSKSRGYDVVKEHFGESFKGILLHDCWSAQNNTPASSHQQCHAHLHRDLNYLIEVARSKWAYDMQQFLSASNRARDRMYNESMKEEQRTKIIKSYHDRFERLLKHDYRHTEVQKLVKRLRKHKDSILTFMNYPDVPSDNNSSERAIRMAKVKQKISGTNRSEHGAKREAVLLSILETAKKQNIKPLEAIRKLLDNKLQFQLAH